MSERRERRFTMDLRRGRILDGTPEPLVEKIPDEEWRPIGEIDPIAGGSTVDLEKARRWRPLSEFRRWPLKHNCPPSGRYAGS
ncbi:MAG TPA: hypothetical protein VHV50_06840 [Actinomycetota bacterium]|jgi:hypothetical protein|nr:hypothetical protein [Actinomycetota bacterium]